MPSFGEDVSGGGVGTTGGGGGEETEPFSARADGITVDTIIARLCAPLG